MYSRLNPTPTASFRLGHPPKAELHIERIFPVSFVLYRCELRMHIGRCSLGGIEALMIRQVTVSHKAQQIVERRLARGFDFSLSPRVGNVLCAP
jgi:hypothetical protein